MASEPVVIDTNLVFSALVSRNARLREEELLGFLNGILSSVEFVEEGAISIGTWIEARRMCPDIDEKAAPFVALTLHLGAKLWSGDEALKQGLRAKGFDAFFNPA